MRFRISKNGEPFWSGSKPDLVEGMLTGFLRMNGCGNAAEVAPGMIESLTEVGHNSILNGPDDLTIKVEVTA